MYNMIKFGTIRYKMTASVNVNPWILIYKFLRHVSILGLPKVKKNRQKPLIQKKSDREKCRSL